METDSIRITKLKGAVNWTTWKFQILVLLKAQGASEVVLGSLVRPEAAPESLRWDRLDAIAQKIIATSVEDSQLLHIMNCTSSQEMWQKLSSVHEQRNQTGIHILQQKWYKSTKDPSDKIAEHIAKIEDLAHRLKTLGEKISDSMIATKILMTLPEDYNFFITAWESTMEEQRTLSNLTERLVAEEMRLQNHKDNENQALLTQKRFDKTGKSNSNSNKNKKFVDQRSNNKSKKPGACNYCKKPGHWKEDCYKLKKLKEDKGEALIGISLVSDEEEYTRTDDWFIDSGATEHMCYRKEYFNEYKELNVPRSIKLGNNQIVKAIGIGDINITAFNGTKWNPKYLAGVLFVPDLCYNLFSAGAALDKGMEQFSDSKGTKFVRAGKVELIGIRQQKLCVAQLKVKLPKNEPTTSSNEQVCIAEQISLRMWHERLAHQNIDHVLKFLQQKNIQVSKPNNFICEGCIHGKIHRQPFPKTLNMENKSSQPGELVHADLCGPMQEPSLNGSLYFLLFKDDYSNHRTLFFIRNKNEVSRCFAQYIKSMKNQTGKSLKCIRTDNGLEFVNQDIKRITDEHGIKHQRTVAYSPEQNGAAERENRTIMEAVRAMLYEKNLPKKIWAEAANTAVYIFNRTGKSKVDGETPQETWNGKKHPIPKLVAFGVKAYTHIPKQKRRKLDSKAQEGVFVGYGEDVKGYRIWYKSTDKVTYERDVVFVESKEETGQDIKQPERTSEAVVELPLDENSSQGQPEDDNESHNSTVTHLSEEESTDEYFEDTISEPAMSEEPEVTRTLRDRRKLQKPKRFDSFLDPDHLLVAVDEGPRTYEEAINAPDKEKWIEAMNQEIESLKKNNTWTLDKNENGENVIGCRWVFKIKRRPDGKIDRYKARLVAKGYTQKHGIDYEETFSPVIKFDSLRMILAIAAARKMKMTQFDIKTAFLNGKLEENIMMTQPRGYEDESGRVCRMQKSLYGLKQASRCWNNRFTSFLKKYDLKQTYSDSCVFTNNGCNITTIIAIYIDDGLIVSEDDRVANELIEAMGKEFEITISNADFFLGFQIDKGLDGSIFLHQTSYASKVLRRFNMGDANPVSIPADRNHELNPNLHKNPEPAGNAPYREAVGCLMYLGVGSRPDIAYALSSVSQYLENPLKIHWNAVKRILKYLKGTVNYGIKFSSENNLSLVGYSDSDFAGDTYDRRSISGYVYKLGSGLIAWNSKKQKVVALSVTEAEFIAAAQAIKELIWLERLKNEILGERKEKPELNLDNQSAIRLLKNPEFHKRSKHIDIKYHFAREKYQQGLFNLNYVPSAQQQADMLTKALPKQHFIYLRDLVGVNKV